MSIEHLLPRISYLAGLFTLITAIGGCSVTGGEPTINPEIRLIERVTKDDDEVVIPYEKYELANGLTVILHEDKSDPLVHVDVTYHVGSAREEIGKSGFAHFFEHMMFQGSENVGDDQHFKIVNEAGGILNGSTNIDRTNYYQTVPKNQLEKILWLEADRMGFLLPAVTQEKFDIQVSTVKNERAQNYDNKPYGLQYEKTIEALYPPGHPYSWMTIGYVEDLDKVGLNDLKAFFRRWYGPNNATLTIGGDIDREQTLRWVQKYFGPIPRGEAVEPMAKQPVKLDENRYLSMEDNVTTPLLRMTIPTTYYGHPDEVALDAFTDILVRGNSSRLYRKLVATGMATAVTGSHSCGELSCGITMGFIPAEGYSLEDMKQGFADVLSDFEEQGVSQDDLIKIKNAATTSAVLRMQSVSGKVGYLALMETLKGNPNQIGASVRAIESLQASDIEHAYKKYVKDKGGVYVRIVPVGEQDSLETPDNWEFPGRDLPETIQTESSEFVDIGIVDSFDRSLMPEAGPIPALQSMSSWQGTLSNGINVIGVQSDEIPTTAVLMRLKIGMQHETLEKLGVGNLTSYVLNESTTENTAEHLDTELAKLSSTVRFYSDGEYANVSVGGLTKNLGATLKIATERLLKPKFDPDEFDRWKKQALKLISLGDEYGPELANRVIPLVLFGDSNQFAYTSIGLEETVERIELDDVREFYSKHYSPSVAEIMVISDLSREEVLSQLSVLESWSEKPVPDAKAFERFPEVDGGTIYFVDLPGAEQSEIRVATRSTTYDALGENYRLTLLNHSLAGSFNSRINLNLREENGYTYGAYGYQRSNEYSGRYVVQTSVRNDVTGAAITEIFSEIDGLVEAGMTEDELTFTRRSIGLNDALSYETPNHKVNVIAQTQRYNLAPGWRKEQHRILQNITVPELNELARKFLDTDEMITVVVGDKAEVYPQLKALGRRIVEVDRQTRAKQ